MLIIGFILAIIFLPTILALFQGVAQSMGQSSARNSGGSAAGQRTKVPSDNADYLYAYEPDDLDYNGPERGEMR